MLTRLDEFENILQMVQQESRNTLNENIPKILSFQPEFNQLCERLDSLEKFIEIVNRNLDVLERKVEIAEEELDIPDKALNVLLKSLNIFGKSKQGVKHTNLNELGVYQPPEIFKTNIFFPDFDKKDDNGEDGRLKMKE